MAVSTELSQASILVIDDEPTNVRLLEKVLSSAGYTNVKSTSDPRDVPELYSTHNFDLLLLDINMPYMNGFEVMERLRQDLTRDSYVPVLVLTAQIDRSTKIRALEMGAKDFVTKPFDQLEVLNRIRNMLEVRLLHNQVRMQNDLLEAKVQERTREIEDTRMEIIRRLGRAAEYRDNETGLHIIRMSKMSQMLGRAMGMNEQENHILLNASPMHDVGKIGIPDKILLKPGKLDPDEWVIMKTHASIGAELLSGHDSELMKMASEIALTHHEKWDGSGYPNGLKGDEIPLVGRIVAVADVFDALTSERPYKKAWPVEEAVEYIVSSAGSHFEPRIVDHFKEILPDILSIRAEYPEPAASN